MRGFRVMAMAALVFTGASSAAIERVITTKTPTAVAACLTTRQVMTNGPSHTKVVAPTSVQQSALGFSFALVSGQELNRGAMAFEKTSVVAQRVGREWLAYELRRYKNGGIQITSAMAKTTYFVKDTVVVIWDTEPGTIPAGRARAERTLGACL